MAWHGAGLKLHEQCIEDWEYDWLDWALFALAMEAFDAMKQALDHGRFKDCERLVNVDVEGTY